MTVLPDGDDFYWIVFGQVQTLLATPRLVLGKALASFTVLLAGSEGVEVFGKVESSRRPADLSPLPLLWLL